MDKLIPYNFTTYSHNWMPEKIETTAASEAAWSSSSWTTDENDPLHLSFECESTMLLLIFADARVLVQNDAESSTTCVGYFKLVIDATDLPITFRDIGTYLEPTKYLKSPYSVHAIAIFEKGLHTLKLRMMSNVATTKLLLHQRRLTILKGFYKGGTT